MSGIEGKVVVITGASSGIGEATALLLAERGATVVLGARRPERLEALAARIEEAGGQAAYARTDVKRREDVSGLVGLARDRYGRVDALVSNAGIGLISPLDDLRVEDWEEMIDVNLKGVLYGIAAALPVFREQGFGHFVQHRLHGRAAHRAAAVGVRRDQERGPHHLRRPAPGGRRQPARHGRLARCRRARSSRTRWRRR